MHEELLPAEIDRLSLIQTFQDQFQKGVAPIHILPKLYENTLGNLRKQILENDPTGSNYALAKRALQDLRKWLDIFLFSYRENHCLTSEETTLVQQFIQALDATEKELHPHLKLALKQRVKKKKDLQFILEQAIDKIEQELTLQQKRIILDYKKMDSVYYNLVKQVFDEHFKQFRASIPKLLQRLTSCWEEWNEKTLFSGKSFFVDFKEELSCSILFSFTGNCYLIFEDLFQLLGVGSAKLALRSICIPSGTIHALIKPAEQKEPYEFQFQDMWLETNFLKKLGSKPGIARLDERIAFEINGQKQLFIIEEYYWDGNLKEYLEYPINQKIDSAKLSFKTQKKIIFDLLLGLVEIHKNQIIHHDIKFDNILVTLNDDHPKAAITDFHLATELSDLERIATLRFAAYWAPPEYAHLRLTPGEKTAADYIAITTDKLDIWCMGLVFYLLIAYEFPPWMKDLPDEANTSLSEKSKLMRDSINEKRVFEMVTNLSSGWLSPSFKDLPYLPLLQKMLEPDRIKRCTALEALSIFEQLSR